MDFYKRAGYDILAITDHRSVASPLAADGILLIPGIEIDYALPGQWVHILGLGTKDSIGQLCDRSGTSQERINLIRRL